jgi:hypothetical protein
VDRVEARLRCQEAARRSATREAATLVATVRALLKQLAEDDPFPRLEGADYLHSFWPWLLAGGERLPDWAVDYALAVGGLAGVAGRLARRSLPPSTQPLQDAGDVVALLHEQVEAVRADGTATPLERARVIGYLAGIPRKAIETSDLAARLERLEAVLHQHRENEPR